MSDEESWPGQEWPGEEQQASPSASASGEDQWPGEEWPGAEDKPEHEGFLASNARALAHGIVPMVGAVAGGAAVGAAAGSVVPGIGNIVGGIVGGIAGGYGAGVAQDKLQEAIPAIDDRAQMQADEEAYPKSTTVSGMLPFVGNPGKLAGSLIERGAGAAMMGGLNVAQQAYQKGDVNPTEAALSAAVGAFSPRGNRVTQAIHGKVEGAVNRAIPGRPGKVENNPAAADAHDAVGDDQPEQAVGDWSEAQPEPSPQGDNIGNPDSRPTNGRGDEAVGKSDPSYAKQQPVAADQKNMTQGQIAPDIQSALGAGNEAPTPAAAPQQRPLGMPAPNYQPPKPRAEPKPFDLPAAPEEPNQVVDAGFPKPGEPVAAGENDATPLPAHNADAFAEAMKPLTESEPVTAAVNDFHEAMKPLVGPDMKGETVEPKSPEQAAAGNYKKSYVTDFKKPITFETHTGQVRRGKDFEHPLPYDYGYVNTTLSSDFEKNGSRAKIDFMQPKKSAPERGTKFFIIDQKHADTGKFDEPKVMAYVKDKDTAVDLFHRGFGDGKGPDRLHDITEVNRKQLEDYFAKHTTEPVKGPYGKKIAKPLNEREGVKAKAEKLRAQGRVEDANALLTAPDEVLAGKTEKLRARKYGVAGKSGYPIDGLLNEAGEPVVMKNKTIEKGGKNSAEYRSQVHKKVTDWYEATKPASQEAADKETNGELLSRVKDHPMPAKGEWQPTFKPKEWLLGDAAKKMLAAPSEANITKFRNAERLLRGNDEAVKSFRDTKREEDNARFNKRTGDELVSNADAGKYKPGGSAGGRNTAEEEMNARVDEKKRVDRAKKEIEARFRTSEEPNLDDILGKDWRKGEKSGNYALDAHNYFESNGPHEAYTGVEPEFVSERRLIKKAGDIKKPANKEIDVSKHPAFTEKVEPSEAAIKRKAEADMLARRKNEERKAQRKADMQAELAKVRAEKAKNGEPVTAAVSEAKPITDKKEPPIRVDSDERERLIAELNKATAKKVLGKDELSKADALHMPKEDQRVAKDLYSAFINDERASLDVGKLKKDFNRLMRGLSRFDPTRFVDNMKKTEHSTYKAESARLPRDKYIESLDQKLHTTGKEGVNEFMDVLKKAKKDWKPIDSEAAERIFHARDADSASLALPGKLPGKTNVESLPKADLDLYNKHLKPVFDANDVHFATGQKLDKDRYGDSVQHHIEHIQNGDTPEYNMLKSQDDPMEQGHYNALSVSANAARDRKYFVMERNSDGKRLVVEPTDKGFTFHDQGKRIKLTDPAGKLAFEDGKKYTVPTKNGPVDFTMRHATVKEKEANIKINGKFIKYFKDARFSALISNAQLGAMARHLQVLHDMTNSEAWKDWTTTNPSDKRVRDEGYETSKMPNFKGVYMHPDLKALFDDFAGNPQTSWQALNAAVTKLIFISPTAHWGNVHAHMVSGRGWDNFSIPKNLRMIADLPMAIKSVMTQDAYQRALNRAGAGTVYGKVITKDIPGQLAKAFNLDVERNPSEWGKVADNFGVPLNDLKNSFYRATNHALWAGSDVFMTLRTRELQRKGMSMEKAVIEAERDIPNYRIPQKIAGSRWAAQTFMNNSLFAFARYHFGMINAYANVFKDLLGPRATMGDRVDAAGKLLAIGLMGMVVYPLLDRFAQLVTGNENAEQNQRGPLTIPHHIVGALRGKEDIAAPVRSVLSVAPLPSVAGQALINRDWRGKNVVEPGSVRAAAVHGKVAGAAEAIGQEGEHWLRGLVAPYNMFAGTLQKQDKNDRGLAGSAKALAKTVRDQALDVKDTSDAAAKYDARLDHKTHKDLKQREKHPTGPLGSVIQSVFGSAR